MHLSIKYFCENDQILLVLKVQNFNYIERECN